MNKKKATLEAKEIPDIQNTIPEVFILESLNKEDEKANRFEGQNLAVMLRLAGMNPKYHYFQNKEELSHLLGLFRQSKYRYLHISTHASDAHIGMTDDMVTYEDFSVIFKGHLKLRRLFFSACQVGNQHFVETVSAKNKGIQSIVAPAEDIQFDHAAAIWSAFYVSIFAASKTSMKQTDIEKRIKGLTSMFPVDFFVAGYDAKNDGWKYKTIKKS